MTTQAVGSHYFAQKLVYNDAGALTNATVTLTVTDPSGATTTPSVTNASTGTYTATFTLNAAGVWYGSWSISGTVIGVDFFQVTATALGAQGSGSYVSLATLKQNIPQITAGDTTRDAVLTAAALAASRQVERYCDGRIFFLDQTASARVWPTRGAIVFPGWGDEKFSTPDIGTAAGIIVETSDDNVTWTAQSPVETWPYDALATNRPITAVILPWPSYILRTTRLIRVTARWGWPEVPTAVEQATLLQALRLFRRPSSPEGVAGSADWGLVRIPNFDPDVRALLADYVAMPLKVG